MAQDIVKLCCVAEEIEDDGDFNENDDHYRRFKLKNKKWQLKNTFQKDDCVKLIDSINLCEQHRTKKICFIAKKEDDRHELVAAHIDTTTKAKFIDNYVVSTIFPIIFKNYKPDLLTVENDNDQQDVMKTYVTTELYNALHKKHIRFDNNNEKTNFQLPQCFMPKLRPYQERTVKWLLKKEQCIEKFPDYYTQLIAADCQTTIYKHIYCIKMKDYEDAQPTIELPPGGILADEMGLGKTVELLALVLLNPRSDQMCEPFNIQSVLPNNEEAESNGPPTKRVCKEFNIFCICADRTKRKAKNQPQLEIIQCQKCKKWQHQKCVNRYATTSPTQTVTSDDTSYLCPACWAVITQTKLISSRATFIVSPNIIKMQWLDEINKHINPSLRVLVYEGLHSGRWISPNQLADYDIVLTDYNILRSEIYHTSDYESDRQTRHQPLSMRLTSPLLMLEWWRVCLDEAQMVESNASKLADMVHMMSAINRWAVTGTPIQRSIDDLRPLLKFVGFNAISELSDAWNNLVDDFMQQDDRSNVPLVDVLQKCMWRTCKSQVIEQICIPPQTEIVHQINLGDLENLFYRDQHLQDSHLFNANIRKYVGNENDGEPVAKISPHLLKLIMKPLINIRQSSTMPVVQISHVRSINGTMQQKHFLLPTELHDHLKTTNESECKIQLRTMASSYNGIAGLYFLKNNYKQAIIQYELVLKLAKDYNERTVTVDSLLQIHALYNLMQANAFSTDDLLSKEKLAEYEKQSSALEWKYLEPYASQLSTVRLSYQSVQEKYDKLMTETDQNIIDFIAKLGYQLDDSGNKLETMLIQKIYSDCRDLCISNDKLNEANTFYGILYIIETWYQKVEKAQQKLIKAFNELQFFTDNIRARNELEVRVLREMTEFIWSVYSCHLTDIRHTEQRANKRKKDEKNQKLCKLCQIRHVMNEFECLLFAKVLDKASEFTEGSEKDSLEIVLIKSIVTFFKSISKFHVHNNKFELYSEVLECFQNRCKKLIKYWIEIEYTVKAYDELDMCKMRISLAENEDEISNYNISKFDIEHVLREQRTNFKVAQTIFVKKLARLKYIEHLEKEEIGVCPICQTDDEQRYIVMDCGHFMCCPCMKKVRSHTMSTKLTCPVCRNVSEQIYYATRSLKNTENDTVISGDYSSKIMYIVRLILKLRSEDTDNSTKIVIFSQWKPILQAIATALTDNGVLHRLQCTSRAIDEFKDPKLNITCMLMPFSRGSKGLNLIEATHVFLVEPILNPGEELQAIGRIHRFGQTKPTTVHRFIVNNTVEQNIFNFIASAGENKTSDDQSNFTHWELENMTLDSLRKLFILKNDELNNEN